MNIKIQPYQHNEYQIKIRRLCYLYGGIDHTCKYRLDIEIGPRLILSGIYPFAIHI